MTLWDLQSSQKIMDLLQGIVYGAERVIFHLEDFHHIALDILVSHAQPLESLVDISFHCLGCLSRGLVWNKSGCLGITTCRCIARRIEKGSG